MQKVLEDMDKVKSWVRVSVTYAAALYIFLGGMALMIVCLFNESVHNLDTVKDLYLTIFPVATGIVTYWFAARSNTQGSGSGQNPDQPNGK